MTSWPGEVGAITVFTEDLAATKTFYADVFAVTPIYEDEGSAAYRFDNIVVNLLASKQAPELVEPGRVAAPDSGIGFVLSLAVEDVDVKVGELDGLGVALLNGPVDRPWGLRTASFRDPAGCVWEIAHPLPG